MKKSTPTRTITITVTQAHILNGERYKAQSCPLYLAAHEAYPAITSMGVMTLGYGGGCIWVPDIARQFRLDFDSGNPVKPFSFEIEVPGMTVTIDVTAEDISAGKPCNSVGCPVYIASKRAIPSVMQVTPGRLVLWSRTGMSQLIKLPESAVSFIRNFDENGHRIAPFSFTVEIPQ